MEVSASFILQMTKLRISKLKEYASSHANDTYTSDGTKPRAQCVRPPAGVRSAIFHWPPWCKSVVCGPESPLPSVTHLYQRPIPTSGHSFSTHISHQASSSPCSVPAPEPSVPLLILREVCRHSGLSQSFCRVFSLWRRGKTTTDNQLLLMREKKHLWNSGSSRIMITVLDLKHLKIQVLSNKEWDFPGGPVVKNPPCNTRDMSLISDWRAKMPHAMGQLRPNATK